MKVVILFCLIINIILLGFVVAGVISVFIEEKTKIYKRCGVLESENRALASQCNSYYKRLVDYKKKMPLKAKYAPGEKVICVLKDKVVKGVVRAVVLFENEQVDYQVEIINNKDKTISNKIDISECDVYPENTLKVA